MEYYYTPEEKVDSINNLLQIGDYEYKHLIKVLRKKCGDKITVTDGRLNIYHCEIKKITKDNIVCEILKKDFNLFEPEVKLALYMSPLRNPSRFEFAIEKAVELGVDSIQPVVTEYTVNKNNFNNTKLERLNKIIIAAMGQSQRCYLPKLYNSISFDEMLNITASEKNKIVMYEFSQDFSEHKFENDIKKISLLIGPEGGFSKDEVQSLSENGWQVKSLGERKFRAETAAIISVFELINNLR